MVIIIEYVFDSGWRPELVIVEHSRGFGPSDISATTLVEKLFAYYAFAGSYQRIIIISKYLALRRKPYPSNQSNRVFLFSDLHNLKSLISRGT